MGSACIIRFAVAQDAAAMLSIYKPFITGTPVTFELEVPTVSEFTERVAAISAIYPWLVAEVNGKVAGYAYASRYRDRIAYQWSVECSIYMAEEYRGKGIAHALYHALFEFLKLQRFANVYAIITTPNKQSEQFHASFGFADIGVFKAVGYKQGKWHDVKWMGLRLSADADAAPSEPLKLATITADAQAVKQIVTKATQLIR